MDHVLDYAGIVGAPLSRMSSVFEHTCGDEDGRAELAQPELELLILRPRDLLAPAARSAERLGSEEALTGNGVPPRQHLRPHVPRRRRPDMVSATMVTAFVE